MKHYVLQFFEVDPLAFSLNFPFLFICSFVFGFPLLRRRRQGKRTLLLLSLPLSLSSFLFLQKQGWNFKLLWFFNFLVLGFWLFLPSFFFYLVVRICIACFFFKNFPVHVLIGNFFFSSRLCTFRSILPPLVFL